MNFLRDYLAGKFDIHDPETFAEDPPIQPPLAVCDGQGRNLMACASIPPQERCDHCFLRVR